MSVSMVSETATVSPSTASFPEKMNLGNQGAKTHSYIASLDKNSVKSSVSIPTPKVLSCNENMVNKYYLEEFGPLYALVVPEGDKKLPIKLQCHRKFNHSTT